MGQTQRKHTHKYKSIRIRVLLHVFRQIPARHPIRNELEGICSDTHKGQDVRVFQVFPSDGLCAEGLRVQLVVENMET